MSYKSYAQKISYALIISLVSLNFTFLTLPQNTYAADLASGIAGGAISGATDTGGLAKGFCDAKAKADAAIDDVLKKFGTFLGITSAGDQVSSAVSDPIGTALGALPGGTQKVDIEKISNKEMYAFVTTKTDKIVKAQEAQTEHTDCIAPLLQTLAKTLARQLIQNITESTVNWINGGFNGNPAFVANTGDFLANTADQVVGDMIFNDPSWRFLCAPFREQVRLAIGLSYQNTSYYNKINCTASEILNNINNAGVDGFFQLSINPQNTPIGAYIIAQGELASRIASRQDSLRQELSYGNGALSYQKCEKNTYDINTGEKIASSTYVGSIFYAKSSVTDSIENSGARAGKGVTYKIENCTVETPGSTISSMIAGIAGNDVEGLKLQAALGNGVDAVLNALFNQLVNVVNDKLKNGVLGSNNTQATKEYKAAVDGLPAKTEKIYSTPDAGTFPTPVQLQKAVTTKINSLMKSEQAYKTFYEKALKILTGARAQFVLAEGCNNTTDTSTSLARARLIASVIANIDGTVDADGRPATLLLNISYINTILGTINANIATLNKATADLASATTPTDIAAVTAEAVVTSITYDPRTIDKIEAWLTQMKNHYSDPSGVCKIDLSTVF